MILILYLANHINKFIIFNHFLLIEPINIIWIQLGFKTRVARISISFSPCSYPQANQAFTFCTPKWLERTQIPLHYCGGGTCLGEAGVFVSIKIFWGDAESKKVGVGSKMQPINVIKFTVSLSCKENSSKKKKHV